MAPEVWQNMAGTKVPMSQSIDVYSYGVIMFEVCYRTKAWKGGIFAHNSKEVIAGKRPRYLSDDDSSSKEEKDGEDGIPEGFDRSLVNVGIKMQPCVLSSVRFCPFSETPHTPPLKSDGLILSFLFFCIKKGSSVCCILLY